MDRSHQISGSFQHQGCKTQPRSVAERQLRTCLVRARCGRGLGCGMSAWVWPGPLSWCDNNGKTGQDMPPRSLASSFFTKSSTATHPASAAQREARPDSSRPPGLIADMYIHTRGYGTATVSGPSSSEQLGPLLPAGGLDQQPRIPQQPSGDGKTIITFAYGANMNFLTLARREVRVLSRDPAFVVDPNVRMVFKHQGGYATLEAAQEGGERTEIKEKPRFRPYDGRVHGVLYRVTREDFEKLSKREGGYVVQEVQVQTYDGALYTALAFVSNPLFKLPQEVLPTEKYLARVREGARDNYLDPGYQAFLSGINTVPGTGLGSEYYNTPSKYMAYSFLVVVALITLAFFFQH